MSETIKQFKEAVISAIHNLPYEEAVKKEFYLCVDTGTIESIYHLSYPYITIGRVMQAFITMKKKLMYHSDYEGLLINNGIEKETKDKIYYKVEYIKWKLTKENGQEATDEDQADETIEKLLNLLIK